MATQTGNDPSSGIGSVLKETRKRQGIEIKTVEERTKIRIRYLRALENEDWDVLPDPAYTRSFLRAYAELLGLDGEVLVDQYSHRVEDPASDLQSLSEPLLEARRTQGRRAPRIGRVALIVLGLAAIAVVLLVIGLVGGGGDDSATTSGEAHGQRAHNGARAGAGASGRADAVSLKLSARTDTQVCLIDAKDRVRIPDQMLGAGSDEGPYVSPRFTVKLDPAQAVLVVDGERARAAPLSSEPAAYRVTPQGVAKVAYTGPGCP